MSETGDRLRVVGGLAALVVGAIHLQQYADFIKDVPTIGTLFLLNGLGAGALCLLLATRARRLVALGGIGLSVGALISLGIARYASGGLFDYVEPTYRGPVVIAIVAEAIAVFCLAAYLTTRARSSAQSTPRAAGHPEATPAR